MSRVGKTKFKGNPIKRPKGVPFLVDCNVKGFDAGTTNVPCFPLKTLWEHSLIPAIKSLIAPNGACAGAQVIFQEDNAGPHTEARYTSWMTETFAALNWKIELQASQGKTLTALFITDCIWNDYLCLLSCPTGPYTNVLDLYIFPSMSHRHSALLQLYNNTEANKEQTWKTIETVWKDTSSSEVSRAFVLAYRIMRLIIEENGNNSWLSHGTPHCDVRRDYENTPTGIKYKGTLLELQYDF